MVDRRTFLKLSALGSGFIPLGGCIGSFANSEKFPEHVMTVQGSLPTQDMGWTLPHEHLFLDERPLLTQESEPLIRDYEEISDVVLPHLNDRKAAGVTTLTETTAVGFGRSPEVLKQLSIDSDINIIMGTGVYLAAGADYIPEYVYSDTIEQLAGRWVDEFENGSSESSIRPGMLNLGIKGGSLSDLDQKVIKAAAKSHLETGLVIGVHIGPWGELEPGSLARAALETAELLASQVVSPSAFIWIHAQNEKDLGPALRIAGLGGYISFDGYRPGQETMYAEYVMRFKEAGLLSQLHFSQDAGWYKFSHENGGVFNAMTPIVTTLLPHLRSIGFSEQDIETIFVRNPASAFQIAKRRI